MGSIKAIPRQISIQLDGMEEKLIRFRSILKLKKDKDLVKRIIFDVRKLEKKINTIMARQIQYDIFKQP